MLALAELYPAIHAWLQACGGIPHATSMASVAQMVTAVLLGQSLRSSMLARTLQSATTVTARHRYRRVRRLMTGGRLLSEPLTPWLVRAALAVVPDPVPHLAMDTVRCGWWEVVTVGVVWHGRVLPVGWEVLPYPWPKGQFTPTVLSLLARIDAAWPADRRPHLVADRGFPSRKLLRLLERMGWGWTIRLRAKLTVGIEGEAVALRDLVLAQQPGRWTCRAATYGTGRQRVAGFLVMGRGDALPVLRRHQANAGSQRQRVRQQAARQREVRDKHPTRQSSLAQQTDGWLILFTSHDSWLAACESYTRRWATEGSYRDAQSGYGGRQGWDLEAALAREPVEAVAESLVGLWALATHLQSTLGHALTQPHPDPAVQRARARWTTTDRLSIWMRGRFALTDSSGELHDVILQAFRDATSALDGSAAPPLRNAA